MKLDLKFRHLPENDQHREVIENDLAKLQEELLITHATAIVEQPSEGTPEVQTTLHLSVPGPDLQITARDYTFAAAWRKLMKSLRDVRQQRALNRQRRHTPQKLRCPSVAASR